MLHSSVILAFVLLGNLDVTQQSVTKSVNLIHIITVQVVLRKHFFKTESNRNSEGFFFDFPENFEEMYLQFYTYINLCSIFFRRIH